MKYEATFKNVDEKKHMSFWLDLIGMIYVGHKVTLIN